MSKTKILSGALVASLLLSACSLKKNMDEMKDSTVHMKDQTDRLAKTSDGLAHRTNALETELTEKETYAMFVLNIQKLFGEDDEVGQWNQEPSMLLYAGAAVRSMRFQFWKGDGSESLKTLDDRFEESAKIFFTRTVQYIPRDFEVNVLNPSRAYKAVASLGTQLDEVRPEYVASLQQAGLSHLSLYDVIVDSLRHQNVTAARTETLPQTAAMVLQWKQEAIHFLQLRHNYFPMMVLTRMTDFPDLWAFPGRFMMTLQGRTVDLSKFDTEQLREWTSWLNKAEQTRLDLQSIGVTPVYNHMFLNLVKSVQFAGQEQLLAASPATLSPLQKMQREFVRAYVKAYSVADPGLLGVQNSQGPSVTKAP